MITIVSSGTTQVKGRLLYSERIIYREDPRTAGGPDEVLVGRAITLMHVHPEFDAVLIFAFSSIKQERHNTFDIGRVLFTRDGKGWGGDGHLLPRMPDDKRCVVFFQPSILGPTQEFPTFCPSPQKLPRSRRRFFERKGR